MTTLLKFKQKLRSLVQGFEAIYPEIRSQGLDEANLRLSYLDPFFESLGWDIRNTAQASLHAREVIVEPPSNVGGRKKRPDYLFRIGGIDKFLCEAKRPRQNIANHYFQIQNYVYNARLWVGVLSDFEHLIVFVVGAQPQKDRPFSPVPNWRLHYTQFEENAERIWNLLSKENVRTGGLERFAQSVPKVTRRGKQGWLIPPDRNRTIDNDFLNFLEAERIKLSKLLHDQNAIDWSSLNLTEGTQLIIDRLLFQRICEDRNIDVGKSLRSALNDWEARGEKEGYLWPIVTTNFHHLSKLFNGGIYGKAPEDKHFIDGLSVSDAWLCDFIDVLSADDGQYLFNVIPVEILGSVYERFLGSVVQSSGKVVPKPEVRKAGGVYYTPRFVVDYIVDQTLEPVLKDKSPAQIANIKILDPACGSGSFLLRAFERICNYHVDWFTTHPESRRNSQCYNDKHGHIKLTTGFKRQLLRNNIFGVDIDHQAVEVTQMSLYLKVLEDETQQSLDKDHKLFPSETYLPDLSDNIKCGNSLIDIDCVSEIADDETLLFTINPFSWSKEFPKILKGGGFDVVIGNPPYLNIDDTWGKGDYRLKYLKDRYSEIYNDKTDILFYFMKRAVDLSKHEVCFIVSRAFLEAFKADKLRKWLSENIQVNTIVDFQNHLVFPGVGIATAIIYLSKNTKTNNAWVWQLTDQDAEFESLARSLTNTATFKRHTISHSQFDSQPWIFTDKKTSRLIDKIDQAGEKLGELLDIGQGMQTGRNNVFGKLDQITIDSWGVPRNLYYVRARNSDIESYYITDSGERLLYLEDQTSFKKLPRKIRNHLNAHSKSLKERAAYLRGDCEWWKYTWPLHKELFSRKKIYAPYLATRNRFALDEIGRFLGLTDTTVIFDGEQPEDIKYILACLNSKLLTYRFRFIAKLKGGGIFEYFWNSISKIPVRRIDFDNKSDIHAHDEIVELVAKTIKLKAARGAAKSSKKDEVLARSIEELERTINQRVYELYGLDESEIMVVEASVSD